MGFYKQTVKDFDLRGKTVLLRADYNVPLNDKSQITSDFRIRQSLPTVKYLLKQDCRVVICSHLGRPEGSFDLKYSLKPVAKRLSQLLDHKVDFAPDCVGEVAEKAVQNLPKGQVLLLENLRFYSQEVNNDQKFAAQLAAHAEVFVQDGFGVVHRAHSSTKAITKLLPSVAGLLLEQEVSTVTAAIKNPQRPLAAIVGGAKIVDKIALLNRFIDMADFVAVGGAMANTFLKARGIKVGKSRVEDEELDLAQDIIDRAVAKSKKGRFVFYVPQDAVVAKKLDKSARTRIVDWDAHVVAEIENYPARPPRSAMTIEKDEMIVDIGPFSGAFIAGAVQLSHTTIWNGTMGVTEVPSVQGPVGPFAHGTDTIVDSLMGVHGNKPYSVIGGGDTVNFLESRNLTDSFSHVSTGGGATLELMSGLKLPGIEALLDKENKQH